ncbi:MAG: MFS transporter [Verrucomicrobia bacterium]|nr:MAG: MFS transporter [Verrucomicrobiota bacterium]TAE88490.1 MAG: MFS transporter [Verrucomicrobiota bacterium]TAF26945.1 MAG: MFS transporter [Verrucomicrobiota bacterium]TAF42202.1 MAG: MFS transporter [Verrucomicrobiota bacterium]
MSHADPEKPNMALFWGCFIALITTAFAFITRAFLVNDPTLWPKAFGLDQVQAQQLFGAGIWPFAISIIVFSLIIDRIGYKTAMWFSFICYALYATLALKAHGVIQANPDAKKEAYNLLYWGSIILGLGNGTVEAYINPVVATIFHRNKTKWLNILHAGWPGGLVIGGLITLALGEKAHSDWRVLVYVIAIPAVIYVVMLAKAAFPVNERVASGTSYREMLAEFGILGAAIASYLITAQLAQVFAWTPVVMWSVFAVAVVAFGAYCRSLGRGILFFLCLVMIPLATTELGTDGAISGIMEERMKEIGAHGLWVLIYTSAIMMVLRFFAGSIINRISPLGLLAMSAVLAVVGLLALSKASSLAAIFIAATVYGFGKTFFWPTTLGVVSEQTPKGGALTLNAIGGIGMLAVGILGGPVIGAITEKTAQAAIEEKVSAEAYASVAKDGKYILGSYQAVDADKVAELAKTDEAAATKISEARKSANQSALGRIAMFPIFMLACYIGLILWFKARGGYKPVNLGGSAH